ncbi:MAG: ATP-binding protein [Bacteroidetes bacterium]|nr:ATP-binding protein [Bacteroidota bacterium]
MEKPTNPFGINRYLGAEYFCDREVETNMLLSNIAQQKHTTLFALRRLGKSALIHHVFHLLSKKRNQKCIYVDIYATQNLKDLTNQLAKSIYTIFPEKKGIGKSFWEYIKLFRPTLSVDELTGAPELSLDIAQPKQLEKTIPQLLTFLDQQNIKIVIALDEFQQILTYPEKNIEAILRTVMQQLQNVTFIFCGSNQTMMHEIFNSAKRPFYGSCSNLHLEPIERKVYHDFITKMFLNDTYKIQDDAIEYILDFTNGYTYYTQRLCHDIFEQKQKTVTRENINQVILSIFYEMKGNFFQYRNLLTPTQWHLLNALALEERVTQPYTRHFIHKYNLGSSAIVKRSLESLIEKEMVYKNGDTENVHYAVYDKFLMRWLQRK